MSWWKNFKASACHHKLGAGSKDQALEAVVELLVKAKALDAKALAAREELASTGVGMGVAIPHVKLAGLDSVVCSLVVLEEPVEWAAVDGDPVDVVFTILRPEERTDGHDPEEHLDMMRWIAGLSREADFRSFARQADKKSALVDLLKEHAPA
jgi:PTS system nitrogen regulatory IIA component